MLFLWLQILLAFRVESTELFIVVKSETLWEKTSGVLFFREGLSTSASFSLLPWGVDLKDCNLERRL